MPDTQRLIPAKNSDLFEQVGMNFDGFTIQEYTEVYRTDEYGNRANSLGCFRDKEIAESVAQSRVDAAWCKTRAIHLLTNGKVGFRVGERVTLVDEEAAIAEVRGAALAKLTPAERKILGV